MRYIATKTAIIKESFVSGYEFSEHNKLILYLWNKDAGRRELIVEAYDEDELRQLIKERKINPYKLGSFINNNHNPIYISFLVVDKHGNIKLCNPHAISDLRTMRDTKCSDLIKIDNGLECTTFLFYGTKEDKVDENSKYKKVTFEKGDMEGLLGLFNYTISIIKKLPRGTRINAKLPSGSHNVKETADTIARGIKNTLDDFHILDSNGNKIKTNSSSRTNK